MALTVRQEMAILREEIVNRTIELFLGDNEEVLRTKSNEIAFPVVGSEGGEYFAKITISIPTGSKGEPYNGYDEAEDYEFKLEQKKIKAQKRAEKKAKKIAKDEELRKAQKGE